MRKIAGTVMIDVGTVIALISLTTTGTWFFASQQSVLERIETTVNEISANLPKHAAGTTSTEGSTTNEQEQIPPGPTPPDGRNESNAVATNTPVQGYAVVSEYDSGTTSCGIKFNESDEFAAHYDLECGTELIVTNLTNAASVSLRVQDKAGSDENWNDIVLSLSQGAAKTLGINGRAEVVYTIYNDF